MYVAYSQNLPFELVSFVTAVDDSKTKKSPDIGSLKILEVKNN